MHFISRLLLVLSLLLSLSAHGEDLESDEVNLRESPQSLYDQLTRVVNFNIHVQNQQEFEQLASDLGFTPSDLIRHMQLLARVNMEGNVNNPNKKVDAESLISQLDFIVQTPQDKAMVLILKGRYTGRFEQQYQNAIGYYSQALALVQNDHDLRSQVIKLNVFDHLGTLHILIRQETAAIMYLNQFKDLAYSLRNDYLIASAESSLGLYYSKTNMLTKALQHYSEAFRITNRANFPLQKTKLQLQLAQVYRDLKQWDEALTNAHEAANGFEELNNDAYLSSCMTVMATVYEQQAQWNKAIDYYLNAQQIDSRRGNVIAQGLNFHNLGGAYSHLKDTENALLYLMKANQIFAEKNTRHYSVYNEILLAEVYQSRQDWPSSITHASQALNYASELKLVDLQINALALQAVAYRQQGLFTQALDNQDRIIELTEQKQTESEDETSYSPSVLTEQKLKIELAMLQAKQSNTNSTLQFLQASLFIGALILLILGIALVHQWRARSQSEFKFGHLKTRMRKDPITGHDGFPAFISSLKQSPMLKPKAIALLTLESWLDSDLTQGHTLNKRNNLALLTSIATALKAKSYQIRPGVIALSFNHEVEGALLLQQLHAVLDQQPEASRFHVGVVNLPLIANQDIKIDADTHFEVLQMALAGARSLSELPSSFVSFKTLDFAPATIFSRPLFLHLDKAIERGLVRVDSNGAKDAIIWPKTEIAQSVNLVANN